MATINENKVRLLEILRSKSVSFGDFMLSSGARSNHYFDCKLTTLDPEGAWLVGSIVTQIIEQERSENARVDGVGGLTMGADPIALSAGLVSFSTGSHPLNVFIVRKTAKSHGRHKLIEGNFTKGDHVVIIDDVVTRGDSTLRAVEAVEEAGGVVEFVIVLVDREEGGRKKIEERGLRVVPIFRKSEIIGDLKPVESHVLADGTAA